MLPDSASTSSTLLARVRDHDPQAWQRLSKLYGPLVFGWARRWGLQANDAADLMQSVFLAVHQNVSKLRSDRQQNFRGWLFTIAGNKWRDQLRARAQEPPGAGGTTAHLALQAEADDDRERSAFEESAQREQAWIVQRAINLMQTDFEDRTWRAFVLTAMNGRSVPEVAQELGISADSVYQARSRVLRRLRQELEGLLD